jgi:hypothetical protein
LQGKPLRIVAPAENIDIAPILLTGNFTMHFPYFDLPSEVSGDTPGACGDSLAIKLKKEADAAAAAPLAATFLTNPLRVEYPI